MLSAQLDGTYHVRLNQTALVKEVTKASGADAVHAHHNTRVWVGRDGGAAVSLWSEA